MKKVLVIVGPTAVGKSALAVELAKFFNGEIISGDSVQVYRHLNIGSGKINKDEMGGIKHHLLDICSPLEQYNVKLFQNKARFLIEEIASKHKLPIICGGTGLYIRACLYDYCFNSEKETDEAFPELSNLQLYNLLKEVDPACLAKIHINNRKRLLRAYNVYLKSGQTFSLNIAQQKHQMLYDAKIIGLNMLREDLYQKINERVLAMQRAGLKEEIKNLLDNGLTFKAPSLQAIGYKEYEGYFSGEKSEEECLQQIQKNTRNFAKRQITFFKNQLPVEWYDASKLKIEKIVAEVSLWMKN